MSGVDDQPKKTLRIALAMRGGVSMAVWIGGAVAELDLLRRAAAGVAGCTCEGDQLLVTPVGTAPEIARAHLYRRMLAQGEYGPVEFDILAGASAGGLNAILYAVAQSYGVTSDDLVHNLWLKDGGLWELIRPPGFTRVPSILLGDERFLDVVSRGLRDIADAAPTGAEAERRVAESVVVELSATMLTDPQRPELGNRASFSFARGPGGLTSRYSTIPGLRRDNTGSYVRDDGTGVSDHLDSTGAASVEREKMALAARATSSFPGAFEPASIHSVDSSEQVATKTDIFNRCYPEQDYPLTETEDEETDRQRRQLFPKRRAAIFRSRPWALNMASAFPFARSGTASTSQSTEPGTPEAAESTTRLGRDCDQFRIVDGGVFDNIPIDRALKAIQRAHASSPTERRLLYLDPQPPPLVTPRLLPTDVSSDPESGVNAGAAVGRFKRRRLKSVAKQGEWAKVIIAGYGLLHRKESEDSEIELIREHNDSVDALDGRLAGLAQMLRDDEAIPFVPTKQYLEARKATESARLARIAVAPGVELNTRPHSARSYHGVSGTSSLHIRRAVGRFYDELAAGTLSGSRELANEFRFNLGDVIAALDAVRILISWVQILEQIPTVLDDPDAREIARYKTGLYRCLTVLVEARRLTVDSNFVAVDFVTGDGSQSGSRTITRAQRLGQGLADQGLLRIRTAVVNMLHPESDSTQADFYAALWATDGEGALSVTDSSVGAGDMRLLDEVWPLLDNYEQRLGSIRRSRSGAAADPRDEVFVKIAHTPTPSPRMFRIVKAFSACGVPTTSSTIRFHRITGNQRPEVNRKELKVLRHVAIATQIETWVRREADPANSEFKKSVSDMNTAIRLERADLKLAGTEIARFSGFLDARWRDNDWHWGRMDAAAGIADILGSSEQNDKGALQALVFDSSKIGESDSPSHLSSVGAETVAGLPKGYLFAIASRIAPLALRALIPAKTSAINLGAALARGALFLVRPLLPLLVLITDPLRAALVFGIALLSAACLGVGAMGWVGTAVLVTVAGSAGVMMCGRGMTTRKRWNRLGEFFEHAGIEQCCENNNCPTTTLTSARKKAVWWWRIEVVLGIGAIAGGVAAAWTYWGYGKSVGGWEFWVVGTTLLVVAVLFLNKRGLTVAPLDAPQRPSPGWTKVIRGAGGGAAIVAAVGVLVVTWADACWSDDWWTHDVRAGFVAGLTITALTCVSLSGWTYPVVTAGVAVVGGLFGGALQWWLEPALLPSTNGWLDVLPIGVWAVIVGVAMGLVPPRNCFADEITYVPA